MFEYVGLSFKEQTKVRNQHKLEGLDAEWREPIYRPISLTIGCIRAILRGRKTQLRQALDPQPPEGAIITGTDDEGRFIWIINGQGHQSDWCPLGKPGDRLWVREPWVTRADIDITHEPELARRHLRYQADGDLDLSDQRNEVDYGQTWRSPREMPRWASRLTLEIIEVRVQCIQDISQEDIADEGGMWRDPESELTAEMDRAGFARWWSEVNAKRGMTWERNPWVWAIRFRRVIRE
ncbi:MAG: hypothetical protein ONB44_05165 [candidate division KSB1 bacterium]|nr:hypothetical protein [candidate division KSB1 bacterium]MDZ7310916.1 hypothetical protein [candidate division KSB1 bacterium]